MRRAREQPVAVSSRATRYALVAFVSLVIFAGGAAAASACAQDVIDDWADNGIVDGTYRAECYENAIAELPEDLRSYSSAADDISRALQQMLLGEEAPQAAPRANSEDVAPSAEENDSGEEAPSEEPDGGEGDADEAAATPAETEPPPPPEAPAVAGDDAVASAAGAGLGDGGDTLPVPVILVLALVGVALASALAILGVRGLKERRAGRD